MGAREIVSIVSGSEEGDTGIYAGLIESQNRRIRSGYHSLIGSIGLSRSNAPAEEGESIFNGIERPNEGSTFSLEKPHTRLHGNVTTIEQDKQSKASQDCYMTGILFKATTATSEMPLIHITDGARAVITDCIFYRGDGQGDAPFIEVEAGSSAIIIGCAFIGTGTVANAVLHAGVITQVQIVGCSGRNVTAFGALTTTTASLL